MRLTTLETRLLWTDRIEVFKILRGFENLDLDRFFQVIGDGARRGHSLILCTVLNCTRRGIVWMWGNLSLPAEFVKGGTSLGWDCICRDTGTVKVFKMRLDDHLKNVRGYL